MRSPVVRRQTLPIEGMPEHKGNTFASAESGKPIPGEEAFDTDNKVLPGGCDGCEKGVWAGGHMPVHQDFPIPVQETEGHGTSVQVDATIKWVLLGVESHEVSSSCA
jgi:hypothetical protein